MGVSCSKLVCLAVTVAAAGCSLKSTTLSAITPDALPDPKPVAKFAAKDVAGDYYFGDGLGVNCILKLTPDSKFTFEWHGCLGVYDKNKGQVTFEGDEVVLHPTSPNERKGFQGTATRFYPVRWVDRLYLVAEDQMLGFCARYQQGWSGGEYDGRSGWYYLRNGAKSARDGKLPNLYKHPDVPETYRLYLDQLFTSRVVKVLDKTHVLLDRGSLQGVQVGTKFAPPNSWKWLSVVKVGEHDCECEIWDKKDKLPQTGTLLIPVSV